MIPCLSLMAAQCSNGTSSLSRVLALISTYKSKSMAPAAKN